MNLKELIDQYGRECDLSSLPGVGEYHTKEAAITKQKINEELKELDAKMSRMQRALIDIRIYTHDNFIRQKCDEGTNGD